MAARILRFPGSSPDPRNPAFAARARKQRDRYIVEHIDLVATIARALKQTRSFPPNIDFEDLRGAGYIGLVQAAGSFSRAMQVKFATYAQHRIRGQMLELVRRRQLRDSQHEPLPSARIEGHHYTSPSDGQFVGRTTEIVPDAASLRPFEQMAARRDVVSILSRLDVPEQKLLNLHFIQGCTIKEIAGRRKIKQSAVVREIATALEHAGELARAA